MEELFSNPFAYFQFYFYYFETLKKNGICCHFHNIFLSLNYNVSRLQNLLNLARAKIAWVIQSYAYTNICLPITTTSHSAEWDFHMRKDFRTKQSQNTSRNVTLVPLKSMHIQRPVSGRYLVSSVFNPSLCVFSYFPCSSPDICYFGFG